MNALHAYNHSDQYARTVRDWATAYARARALTQLYEACVHATI